MGDAERSDSDFYVRAQTSSLFLFLPTSILLSHTSVTPPLSTQVRYYVGHKGKFAHEFLEFEFRPDGRLRYANNSNYKGDAMIRKEVYVSEAVLAEVKRIVEIIKEDDRSSDGRQEFEVVMGNQHISFATAKIGSSTCRRADPEGLRIFYYMVQDLKCWPEDQAI